jgi:hypothetical protein
LAHYELQSDIHDRLDVFAFAVLQLNLLVPFNYIVLEDQLDKAGQLGCDDVFD